jgi:transposase-like protein
MFMRLRGLLHRPAIYLASLSARENHMLVKEMYCVSCKRSGSTKRNGPHRQQCVDENSTS